ncbi:hypothetical protein ACMX2H_13535 [Arthrobacter sulfonylureivorans]|uniref:hypothetical protein n=1 Tax=Arthrobacter sulfonylureivorans TaxID=2486855 RepID=UPI0039E3C1D7
MITLPEAYQKYLSGLSAHHAEALRPVFLESAAEGEHGIMIRGMGSKHVQAFVDDSVPFGEIREVLRNVHEF